MSKTLVNGSRGVVVCYVSFYIDEASQFGLDLHALYAYFGRVSAPQCLPVVKFANGERAIVPPVQWARHDSEDRLISSRWQIPLKLAWALTIHKSQGMSIDFLEVACGDVFEYGQVRCWKGKSAKECVGVGYFKDTFTRVTC